MKDFRKQLQAHEFPFEPESWNEMEKLLTQQPAPFKVSKAILSGQYIIGLLLLSVLIICFDGANNLPSSTTKPPIEKTAANTRNVIASMPQTKQKPPQNKQTSANAFLKNRPSIKKSPTKFSSNNISFNNEAYNIIQIKDSQNIKKELLTSNFTKQTEKRPLTESFNQSSSTTHEIINPLPKRQPKVLYSSFSDSSSTLAMTTVRTQTNHSTIFLNISAGLAWQNDIGFQSKLKASYALSKNFAIGAGVGYTRFQPSGSAIPFGNDKWTQQEQKSMEAQLLWSVMQQPQHLIRLKTGIELFWLKTTERTLLGTPDHLFTPPQIDHSSYLNLNAGLEYQYFLGRKYAIGLEAGISTGVRTTCYSALMLGWRF